MGQTIFFRNIYTLKRIFVCILMLICWDCKVFLRQPPTGQVFSWERSKHYSKWNQIHTTASTHTAVRQLSLIKINAFLSIRYMGGRVGKKASLWQSTSQAWSSLCSFIRWPFKTSGCNLTPLTPSGSTQRQHKPTCEWNKCSWAKENSSWSSKSNRKSRS